MKAVNLIPTEERRGTRTGGSGAGIASYVLIAVLALMVGGTYLYVSAGNTVKTRTAEIAKVKATVATEQATVNALQPYVDFATTAQTRVTTVRQIADGRFSWYLTMRDLSRVLPRNVWLTSFTGTVAPGVAFGDGGGATGTTGTLRAQMPSNPAIELSGCTVSNDAVVRLLSRLRLINGVVRVSLAGAEKATSTVASGASGTSDSAGTAAAGSSTGGDCRNGSDRFPQFSLVIFFKPMTTLPASVAGAAGATPAAATTPAPATSGQPATTTPAAPATGTAPAAGAATPAPASTSSPSSTPASTGATK